LRALWNQKDSPDVFLENIQNVFIDVLLTHKSPVQINCNTVDLRRRLLTHKSTATQPQQLQHNRNNCNTAATSMYMNTILNMSRRLNIR
jgi:hypothetical protein